jgi:predicted amidophosphoribosyltransferase
MFCGVEVQGVGICDNCNNKLPYISERKCVKCGGEVGGDGKVCIECKRWERLFNRCFVANSCYNSRSIGVTM